MPRCRIRPKGTAVVYEWELDEWRAAVRAMTESELVAACGHSHRSSNGRCPDCGDAGQDDVR